MIKAETRLFLRLVIPIGYIIAQESILEKLEINPVMLNSLVYYLVEKHEGRRRAIAGRKKIEIWANG